MLELIDQILPLLVPVLALLIGLVVVGSIFGAAFIVRPLVKAIARLADVQDGKLGSPPESRLIEQRLARLEETLERLVEEREFDRKLQAASSDADWPNRDVI